MSIQLDIKKSIERKRVTQIGGLVSKLNEYVIWSLIIAIPTILGIVVVSSAFNSYKNQPSFQALFIDLIFASFIFGFVILLINKIATINKLTMISGSLPNLNKNTILECLSELKYKILENSERCLIVGVVDKFRLQRTLVILFDENNVYLNCSTFTVQNFRTPLYFIADKNVIDKVIDNLNKSYAA